VPFARTKKEREATKDPRLSIEERYSSHDDYVKAITEATKILLADDLLIQEDADRYIEAAKKRNPLDPNVPLLPLVLNAS